jgi:hypothetical protein
MVKVAAAPAVVVPTGITNAQVVGGNIVAATQGAGDGIFSKLVDVAKLAFMKGPTVGATSPIAAQVGGMVNNGTTYEQAVEDSEPAIKGNGMMTLIWIAGLLILAKLLNIIK